MVILVLPSNNLHRVAHSGVLRLIKYKKIIIKWKSWLPISYKKEIDILPTFDKRLW